MSNLATKEQNNDVEHVNSWLQEFLSKNKDLDSLVYLKMQVPSIIRSLLEKRKKSIAPEKQLPFTFSEAQKVSENKENLDKELQLFDKLL